MNAQRTWALSWLMLSAAGLFVPSATAQDTPRVAALVRQLGAATYAERQQADEQLQQVGLAARESLEAAARGDDPEVRLRARRLLKRLELVRLWSDVPLKLPAGPLAAREAYRRLAEASRTSLSIGGEALQLRSGMVRFGSTPRTFWEAVEAANRQTGNQLRFDAKGDLGLYVAAVPPVGKSDNMGQRWLGMTGPLRLEAHPGPSGDETPSVQLNLSWESRFRLLGCWVAPRWVSAVTRDGTRLQAPTGKAAEPQWLTTASTRGRHETTLYRSTFPRPLEQLRELTLRWGMVAAGPPKSLDIKSPAPGRSYRQDDVTVAVTALEVNDRATWRIRFRVVRPLLVAEHPDMLLEEIQADVIGAQGRKLPVRHQHFAVEPDGLHVHLHLTPPADGRVPTIRVHYVKLRSSKQVEFRLTELSRPAPSIVTRNSP